MIDPTNPGLSGNPVAEGAPVVEGGKVLDSGGATGAGGAWWRRRAGWRRPGRGALLLADARARLLARPRTTRRLRLRHTRTIRLRLTVLYGTVFLITGAVLLTLGYLVVRDNLDARHTLHQQAHALGIRLNGRLYGPVGVAHPFHYVRRALAHAYRQAAGFTLHRLLLEYIGALVVMLGVSVAAGWLLAGRALAPLRSIIATAQRVSGENLGERIALDGPADELKELADTFDRMLARLDSAFASQRRFVANASHELRTPLAIMRTEIDVALDDPDASELDLRDMGDSVREAIDRSESLIAALLTLARTDGVTLREHDVDLAQIVADCITDARAQSDGRSIVVESELEPAVVRGDAALLQRMVGNLIENGLKHNHVNGHVRVTTATVGPDVELVVENSGPLLEQDSVLELTEPFRRMNRTAGGFGLGLSIVRSIVDVHRARLELTAREAGGLRVRVLLPNAGVAPPTSAADGGSRSRSLTRT